MITVEVLDSVKICILTHSRIELYPVVEVDYGHSNSHAQKAKKCYGHTQSNDASIGQFVPLLIDLLVIPYDTLYFKLDCVA